MFTGIVEGTGLLKKVEKFQTHARLAIRCSFSLKGTKLGDSVAVDGCCLTVTQVKGREFSADISPETLSRTTLGGLKKGMAVNLERPLRLGDRLGGHVVQGHVDGVGKLISSRKVKADPENYFLLKVQLPKGLRPYMVDKGSVTIDGISLTVNEVKGDKISLCIIPHTQERTTLTQKKPGAKLNIEADIFLKYLEKLAQPSLTRQGRNGRKRA